MGRRNAILGVVAIVAILAGVGAWAAFRRPTKLNVLLITVDTLRADHVGAYGYRRATTPNLDALAAESKVFRLAFSQAPETNPSLASVMTCLYPHETTVYRNFHLLPSKPRTLAEILAARGLATGAVVTNFSLRRGSGLERGFADYDDRMDDLATPKWEGIERIAPKTTAAAVEWLRGHAGERFFLWVHYMDPHAPYMPPPPYDTMFPVRDPGDTGPDITLPFLEGGLGIGGIPLYAQLGDHNDPRYYASQYDGEIRFFDHWLGELLKEVRAQGLLDRTLIVVAADHGEGMGEYGYWFNHPEFLWNGLIHVPLVVRLPGEARHEEIATPVALVDVLPTILEVLSIEETPASCRGRSLLHPAARPIFSASYMFGLDESAIKSALIANDRKLLFHGKHPMFFDLQRDFRETNDLLRAGNVDEIATARAMKDELKRIAGEDSLHLGAPVNWDILPESLKRLKALGYVQ
ncbi:MAG TPA: sulfatase [Candidatus Binatia bacterium]|nr:sulfatase [Candidatus Binatia bacterium]